MLTVVNERDSEIVNGTLQNQLNLDQWYVFTTVLILQLF